MAASSRVWSAEVHSRRARRVGAAAGVAVILLDGDPANRAARLQHQFTKNHLLLKQYLCYFGK